MALYDPFNKFNVSCCFSQFYYKTLNSQGFTVARSLWLQKEFDF